MTLFVTLAPRRELAFVRTLEASVRRHHPDGAFLCLSLDPLLGDEPKETWGLERLDTLPERDAWRFQRPPAELPATILPVFLREALATLRPERLVYLQPRSLVLSPLSEALNADAPILALPRILTPFPDLRAPGDDALRAAGVVSDAFLVLRPDARTEDFLIWWAERTLRVDPRSECAPALVPRGLLELALTCIDGIALLRDPTYGVSGWNLHERGAGLQTTSDSATLDGQPVRLIHFTGLEPERIENIDAGQDRFTLSRLPGLRPLWEAYASAVLESGHRELVAEIGGGERFDDGVAIPEFARTLWRENPFLRQRFPQPLMSGPGSLSAHLQEPVGRDGRAAEGGLPRLCYELWRLRPDLQAAFPDPWGSSRADFTSWVRSGVDPDAHLDPAFHPSAPPVTDGAAPPAPHRPLHRRLAGAVARRVLPKPLLDALYFGTIAPPPVPYRPARGKRTPVDLDPTLPPGLNVAGFLTGEFGLGEAGRSIVHAIRAAGVPHVLRDFRVPNKRYGDATFTDFTERNPYAVNLIMVNANELPLIEQAFGETWFEGRRNVGLWYWELPEFPREWYEHFEKLDEVWVTSGYTAEALARVSPIPVVKVTNPIVIDTERVAPARSRFGLPEDAFLFVFSFDFHSYLERKNPMAVAEAFRRAFGSRRDVGLVFKSINGAFYPDKLATMQRACDGLNVFLIEDYLDRYETFDLFKSCDALISLHRAEGLGLGMAEAMALGIPVIGTGYSGNMEFMNVNNSLPVRYGLTELEQDHGVYKKGQIWAEPDIDHAAECLLRLADDREFAGRLGEAARDDMKVRFSAAAAGMHIAQRLSRLTETG